MEDELAIIEKQMEKIDSYLSNKKKDVAILKQVLEPVTESTDNLTDVMKELVSKNDFVDKDFNKKIVDLIGNILKVFQNFKTPDFSSIASEIKNGNDNISKALNTPNQSEEVVKMLSAYLNKQSMALERLTQSTDYTSKFDELIKAMSNKTNDRVEKISFKYDESGTTIREAIPTYKK